jgi:hypothetical protein
LWNAGISHDATADTNDDVVTQLVHALRHEAGL